MSPEDLARYYQPRDEQETHLLTALRDRLATLKQEADDDMLALERERQDFEEEVARLENDIAEKFEQIANLKAQNARVLALVKQLKEETETETA